MADQQEEDLKSDKITEVPVHPEPAPEPAREQTGGPGGAVVESAPAEPAAYEEEEGTWDSVDGDDPESAESADSEEFAEPAELSGHAPSESSGPAEPAASAERPQEPRSKPAERPGMDQRGRRERDGGRGRRMPRRQGRERRPPHPREQGHQAHQTPAPPRQPGRGKPVKVEILANASFEETRIAVLENGRLAELLWDRKSSKSIVGNIYKGVVENVLPGISSAFVDIGFDKNAYLYISDVLGDTHAPIDRTLKKGQQVMVQVAKEAIGTKGMKVTMNVALPGRYLVFMPFDKEIGVSKNISSPEERSRLSTIIGKLVAEQLEGRGVVVRTEAEGATDAELQREVKYLWRTWEAVCRRQESSQAPSLLHKDLDLTMQVSRDMLTDEVFVYLMDDKEAYHNTLDFVGKISPELKDRVQYYDGKTPIFTAFNIDSEIEKLRQIKVSLPSGGTIIVQEAESLCAIDVNTGRFTGSKSQEETVTMTNIEAAHEVAHQLRLRNIGGIIVIDFIDMKKASNRNRVMEALAEAVRRDRAKIRILPITRLGLIEMTRERKRESTVSLMTDECPQCRGAGRVLSAESLRIRIQREIREMTQGRPGGQIRLQLHPKLVERFKEMQNVIEKNVHRSIKIYPDPLLPWEDYKIILE